jgi:endoglucanase
LPSTLTPPRPPVAAMVATLVLLVLALSAPSLPASASPDRERAVAATPTPVARHGQLTVCGVRLCDRRGRPIQLTGMSTHGLQWYADCVNARSLDALAGDWRARVVRLSTYVQEGGYAMTPVRSTRLVGRLIEQATARGLYVIVDWHILTPGDPRLNLARAERFFTAIAGRYGDQPNLLYEIANEPNGVGWDEVASYAEELIPTIRAIDPEAPVIVGTRAWSSLGVSDGADESEVLARPVHAANVLYSFHFYAASHGAPYLDALRRASRRLPMFVTEFGTQTFTGDGPNDFASADRYLTLMERRSIGWTSWNFSDDHRSGAAFVPGTCPRGPFAGTSRLKPAGRWIRAHLRAAARAH